MTRLIQDWIKDIPLSLPAYDEELRNKTGKDLLGLALAAAGQGREFISKLSQNAAAIVPVCSGQGLIPDFVEAVAAIVSHLGMEKTLITRSADVAGFAEAVDVRADIVFMADDLKFIAYNVKAGRYIDNAYATAAGYVHALEAAAGGLKGRDVLVIGGGRVGSAVVQLLREKGSQIFLYDVDHKVSTELERRHKIVKVNDIDAACRKISMITDASPAENLIGVQGISDGTIISSPGVPHGLTPEALAVIGDRLIHDPLQLGVATMAIMSWAL